MFARPKNADSFLEQLVCLYLRQLIGSMLAICQERKNDFLHHSTRSLRVTREELRLTLAHPMKPEPLLCLSCVISVSRSVSLN